MQLHVEVSLQIPHNAQINRLIVEKPIAVSISATSEKLKRRTEDRTETFKHPVCLRSQKSSHPFVGGRADAGMEGVPESNAAVALVRKLADLPAINVIDRETIPAFAAFLETKLGRDLLAA